MKVSREAYLNEGERRVVVVQLTGFKSAHMSSTSAPAESVNNGRVEPIQRDQALEAAR